MGARQSQSSSPRKDHKEDPPSLPQYEPLNFRFEKDSVSFKKLSATSVKNITSVCYIPEIDLLLILSSRSIYIYNPQTNFKLIAVRTTKMKIYTVIYSKHLRKIIVGGSAIQIWHPRNLKVEARSFQLSNDSSAGSLAYLPISDVIAIKTETSVSVSDRNLATFRAFELSWHRFYYDL